MSDDINLDSEVRDIPYDVAIFVVEHSFTGSRSGIVIPHRQGFQRSYIEYLAVQMLKPGEIIINTHRLSQELNSPIRLGLIMEEGDDDECDKKRGGFKLCFSGIVRNLLETLIRTLFRILRM